MLSLKTILVPIVSADTPRHVVHQAAWLARRFHDEIILLHVVTPFSYPVGMLEGGHEITARDLHAHIVQECRKELDETKMKKSIDSLAPLPELPLAANRRYPEFISTLEDEQAGTDKVNKICQPKEENDRSYRGFNFFDPEDEELFQALGSGEFNISGFQSKDLRPG